MKKLLKILGIVFTVIIVSVLVFSVITGTISYPFSFLAKQEDTKFSIENNCKEVSALIKGDDGMSCKWFNYFGVKYTADIYFKGTLTYGDGFNKYVEDFFLEPGENKTFYSFIDGFLENKKMNKIYDLQFVGLNKTDGAIILHGISVFNRNVPHREVFIESHTHKLGIDLHWGGALSYLEALDENVEAVSVDGKIKVDSNASKRYNAKVVNKNVNLINRNDTGRLVQQSYYGTMDYDYGVFMENDWKYNPVQGGNQFNDASKIVDLRINEDSVYVKCRPLDWAKEKEFITPSYMEATYSFEGDLVHASCRFVDFSGYPSAVSTQETPAFYCIEPLNRFVYYAGDKPWSEEKLTVEPDLIFWPDAGYPNFKSQEHWSAFTGEFDDSFGIGVYMPEETTFLSGVYARGETVNEDPSKDGPTSYIAVIKEFNFESFSPFSYEYFLATGTAQEIREDFKTIEVK